MYDWLKNESVGCQAETIQLVHNHIADHAYQETIFNFPKSFHPQFLQ